MQPLLKQIMTKEELIVFIEDINFTENLIFKDMHTPLSEKIKEKTSSEFVHFVKKLEEEDSHFHSPNQQSSFFQNLKTDLKNIPQLKLEIAFEPSVEFLEKIKQWFQQRTGRLILDLSQNPGIVAGAVITYRGKYKNLSVAKKIDELFLQ